MNSITPTGSIGKAGFPLQITDLGTNNRSLPVPPCDPIV